MIASFYFRLILLICIWGSNVSLQTLSGAESRTIIVFGDSITEGGSLPAEQRAFAWVNLIQKEAGERIRLINEGKGGRPTNSLKEFDAMLGRRPKADGLVLALGTNDSRDISDQCVPRAVANLRAMVERARTAYGAHLDITIVGPPNIRKKSLGPTRPIADQREKKLQELGVAFSSLAKDLRCEFVSLYGVVPESSLMKDGVHPDADGNTAIAKAMEWRLLIGNP